jgi:hypothetical protein
MISGVLKIAALLATFTHSNHLDELSFIKEARRDLFTCRLAAASITPIVVNNGST